MSKYWHKPYDDRYWETLHAFQWRIFSEHIRLDEREELERMRDLVEYAMAFHNYEAVQAVQKAREEESEQSYQEPEISSEDAWYQQLQAMGIDLDKNKVEQARAQAKAQEASQQRSAPSSRQRVQEDIMRVHRKG